MRLNLFINNYQDNFVWGEFSTVIHFGHYLSFTPPVEEIAKEISSRVNKVREWVNSCKATAGSVEIKELIDLVADLHNAGRIYYRATNGTIKKLE